MDSTPVPRKIARLHLICDILHNSAAAVPSAWKYRQEFQARLGVTFDHFATIYHSFPGRITAETFKKQITSVVDIWEDWIVFSPEFTWELRARLDSTTYTEAKPSKPDDDTDLMEKVEAEYTSKFKAKSFQPAQDPTALVIAPQMVPADDKEDDVDGAPIGAMDVDGVPLEEDVDGIPLEEDLDGVPLMEDVGGASLDGDIDGVPIGQDSEMASEDDGFPLGDGEHP